MVELRLRVVASPNHQPLAFFLDTGPLVAWLLFQFAIRLARWLRLRIAPDLEHAPAVGIEDG